MTVAAPPVAPVHENGINGGLGHHVNTMSLPRFHPIAMNPGQAIPPEHLMHGHHQFRPFPPPPPPPPMQEPGPPAPVSAPAPPAHHPHIDQIEARLRQLEHEEAARMAARSHLLAMRKREDEDFRRLTENAEAEEEELRRQRKRLKRESMGLGYNAGMDSPPLRPTPPRRLSETNAATTLAFFKQQSPPEPRPIPPPPTQAPAPHVPPPPPAPQHIHHDPTGATSIRRKQKYTIKNVEAWGERHGRPAAHDPSGRALWKRPSDGSLVYLTCPVSGCGKADFVTLHGFMCHLTKKHKDRSLGSQSRALEVCGLVYDPNAPLPPVANINRASTEESRLESGPTDHEGYQQDIEYSSASDEEESHDIPVKTESTDRTLPAPPVMTMPPVPDQHQLQARLNGSTKQSISSIIDRDPESDPREQRLDTNPPRPMEIPMQTSPDHKRPFKDEAEFPRPREHEKENTDPKDTADTQ
ncbi:uncharacterized protein BO95DRAFT_441491 [Aspergillus brunneoviolaceus CBS 621.78]|uniref:Uncharacterized protein n=1 Tax=Aspergillus brunneoviolaceus CBS 621.78 TaxID=1450534 RepID=A0ACD1GCY3_9EURO|nr:hypothetical protein BO95DRAFT_441491 [Aspergillus brunneoviolaceus CBS 621.78]RAH47050.1 hypothetical protein BO95DRAFT_441491 [Aspergillus brunneoviolaceus CBS 621.78]